MNFLALSLLLFAEFGSPEVVAPNGAFVARIEKARGQERVPDELARWNLTVDAVDEDGSREERWSCAYRHDDRPRSYSLSDDGGLFVVLEETYHPGRAVVRVFENGREAAAVNGAHLRPDHGDLVEVDGRRRWLSEERERSRLRWEVVPAGPTRVLDVVLRSGSVRTISWSEGARVRAGDVSPPLPTVHPAVNVNALPHYAPAHVDSAEAPPITRVGEELPVSLRGHYPTLGWQLFGFTVEHSSEGDVVVVPVTVPPRSAGASAQVLDPFSTRLSLRGLPPGHQRIVFRGRTPEASATVEVEVLPAGLLLEVAVFPGFDAPPRRHRLYAGGVVETDGEFHASSPDEARQLERLVEQLPDKAPRGSRDGTPTGHYEFRRWFDGAWRVVRFPGDDLPAAARALVSRLP